MAMKNGYLRTAGGAPQAVEVLSDRVEDVKSGDVTRKARLIRLRLPGSAGTRHDVGMLEASMRQYVALEMDDEALDVELDHAEPTGELVYEVRDWFQSQGLG